MNSLSIHKLMSPNKDETGLLIGPSLDPDSEKTNIFGLENLYIIKKGFQWNYNLALLRCCGKGW